MATGGGNNKWMVLLSGLTQNSISNWDPSSTSSASAASKTSATTVIGGSTVVVTVGPTSSSKSGSGGPNKAGIAAGVVVGVVALAGIIAGVVFYLKYRRHQALEEEYKRQATVNSFFAGSKMPSTSHSSMNDTRLDPEVMLRRQSDGSIADNQDYSRRILKVSC